MNASNLAMFFYLLRKMGQIQNLNDTELSLLITMLTGKSDSNLRGYLGKIKVIDEDYNLKVQQAKKFKKDLIIILKNLKNETSVLDKVLDEIINML